MGRSDDVAALLERADQQMTHIRRDYERSLGEQRVAPILKVDIKNLLENLRSVLDYLAHEMREKFCPTADPKKRFYFPILPDDAQFRVRMAEWYPGLESAAPAVYKLLESVQPYRRNDQAWLGQLNQVNNEISTRTWWSRPRRRRKPSRFRARAVEASSGIQVACGSDPASG